MHLMSSCVARHKSLHVANKSREVIQRSSYRFILVHGHVIVNLCRLQAEQGTQGTSPSSTPLAAILSGRSQGPSLVQNSKAAVLSLTAASSMGSSAESNWSRRASGS
ncbi:unnamed protein product [Urochloa humidicola]